MVVTRVGLKVHHVGVASYILLNPEVASMLVLIFIKQPLIRTLTTRHKSVRPSIPNPNWTLLLMMTMRMVHPILTCWWHSTTKPFAK